VFAVSWRGRLGGRPVKWRENFVRSKENMYVEIHIANVCMPWLFQYYIAAVVRDMRSIGSAVLEKKRIVEL
jgi:hypothetical protein